MSSEHCPSRKVSAAWITGRALSWHYLPGAETITATQVAGALGLSERTARLVLHEYVTDGWLRIANPSNRRRAYSLSASYRQYIGKLSA